MDNKNSDRIIDYMCFPLRNISESTEDYYINNLLSDLNNTEKCLVLTVAKMKKITLLLMSSLLISMVIVGSVFADCQLNLPEDPVDMLAVYGIDSYFDITLSMVPAGYDVTNGVYAGWCIDSDVIMNQTTVFSVMLYSTCDHPTDPAAIEWDKVNYILNNKPLTATRLDIQYAIWHYANLEEGWTPLTTPTSIAIVADAEANGTDFVPEMGEVVAVICYPDGIDYYSQTPPYVQMSIIEVTIPGYDGLSPGFWKHNLKVYLGETRGSYSRPHDGEDKMNAPTLLGYLTTIGVSATDAYAALRARGPGSDQVRLDMANAFNAVAGYTPYSD
jgi:hypothetical protein